MDFDSYLVSADALRQTESSQGTVLHPGQLLDGMRVVAFLGRGATSEVWRVHDLQQDRDYALKIFVPTSDTSEQARQRFLTEARALDEFRHPNLMRRYRLQETGDHPYFTMDVLRPLPERQTERSILRVLDDVLTGLDALHTRGITHRDIKPANILLDDNGHAVLADLGVAHIADTDLAKRLGNTGTSNLTLVHGSPFVGTPRYAAPEQLAGEDVSPATDIYALGVVLEQLFGGRVPLRWRVLLRRMTMARPCFRLQSVQQVRRYVSLIRLFPWILRTLAVLVFATLSGAFWHLAQPTWIELPDSCGKVLANPQRLVITLDGGHYIQPQMHFKPLLGPVPNSALTATNVIERQFQKMFAAEMRRYPIYIKGKGTLKCPDLTFCEVHLASGVTFITTGRFKPDGYAIKEPVPPPDADWDNRIGYPAYVVEPGARLVFTENNGYPASLIRHLDSSSHSDL